MYFDLGGRGVQRNFDFGGSGGQPDCISIWGRGVDIILIWRGGEQKEHNVFAVRIADRSFCQCIGPNLTRK